MAWTDIARRQYEPQKGRYACDLSDAEWAILEPMLPPARRRSARGSERAGFHRKAGLPMADAAEGFPPFTAVQYYFYQ